LQKPKPKVFFVLGCSGVGKDTQCKNIVNHFKDKNFVHISVGELLKKEAASASETSHLINNCYKRGKVVPAEVTIELLRKEMEKSGWHKKKYLIDGFPRNVDSVEGW
jgi:UMP-CMP kinase